MDFFDHSVLKKQEATTKCVHQPQQMKHKAGMKLKKKGWIRILIIPDLWKN